MKIHSLLIIPRAIVALCALVFIFGAINTYGQIRYTDATNAIDNQLVAAITTFNYEHVPDPKINLEGLLDDSINQRKQVIESLLKIFNDPKSTVYIPKCCAAYYLGVLHAAEAADSLAAQITIRPPIGGHEPLGGYDPVVTALIEIGYPSIPAVIRNLAENDDAKVRELSLKVLTHIDNDKDISQLRLQKALKAEKDSQKQARLQATLKALAEISIAN